MTDAQAIAAVAETDMMRFRADKIGESQPLQALNLRRIANAIDHEMAAEKYRAYVAELARERVAFIVPPMGEG